MTTRATKLFSAEPAGGVSTTVYTVPAGFTIILKSIVYTNNGDEPVACAVWVQDGSGHAAYLIGESALVAGTPAVWSGDVVLVPGDTIRIIDVIGATVFWGSGAKLLGLAP